MGIPLSLPLRGGGTGSVSLNHYTGVLSPSPTQSGGGNGLSFGWHLFLPLTVFLFSISYSLSLLCLGLSSSSSLASSSLHLLYPLGFLSFLGLSRVPWVGTSKYLSPQLLALSNFSYQPLPLRPPKMGASRGGGRFWHSTPQLQVWAQGLFPCLSVYLTPAIWGGYWATTTTTRRSVLLCPVADRKTCSSVDNDGLGLMPNGQQIRSDSFQTRSDQAWTEMAWEVAAAGTGSAFIQNRKSHF